MFKQKQIFFNRRNFHKKELLLSDLTFFNYQYNSI